MNTTRLPARASTPRLIAPGKTSALGAALCASFTAGSALAVPIAVDIADVTLGLSSSFTLDINGDTTPEYTFQQTFFNGLPFLLNIENNVNTFANQVLGFVVATDPDTGDPIPVNGESKPGTYASALAANDFIGFNPPAYMSGPGVVLSGKTTTVNGDIFTYGQFYDSGLAYVGLQFDIGGSTHYGWVEAIGGDAFNLMVTRYGYECAPDTGIAAGDGTVGATCPAQQVPEPGSLALLIAGAAGVLALRRRQRAAA